MDVFWESAHKLVKPVCISKRQQSSFTLMTGMMRFSWGTGRFYRNITLSSVKAEAPCWITSSRLTSAAEAWRLWLCKHCDHLRNEAVTSSGSAAQRASQPVEDFLSVAGRELIWSCQRGPETVSVRFVYGKSERTSQQTPAGSLLHHRVEGFYFPNSVWGIRNRNIDAPV